MMIIYGIANCDTVKKARAWLAEHGMAHEFYDFKKRGAPTERLADWAHAVGWPKLINHQGSTWRRLDAASQASASDAAGARALVVAQPSMIKRPVVEWPNQPTNDSGCSSGTTITVGFDAHTWKLFLQL